VSQNSPEAVRFPKLHFGLPARLALLAAVFFAEKVFLGGFVDSQRAQAAQGLGNILRVAQHWGFRFLVTFLACLAVFAYVQAARRLTSFSAAAQATRIRFGWILVHAMLVALLVPVSYTLYGSSSPPFAATAIIGMLLGAAAAMAGLLAVAPWSVWLDGIRALGMIWFYAAVTAAAGIGAWHWSEKLWEPAAVLTFDLVWHILSPILPTLRADAATRVLSTDRFAVEISETCSGLEGMGLITAFSIAWLLYFRREYFFPRSLLLVPAGLVAIYALNALRICVLMLIGYAGFPDIASYGFHSQAGWIAFNATAGSLVFFSRRSTWLNRTASGPREPAETDNPTAAYLMPLLAILAAGMLSLAVSSGFEILYPLRLVAGTMVLWIYRKSLSRMLDWHWSWRGPAVGVAVFLLWVSSAHLLLAPAPLPAKLLALPSAARAVWLASRFAASILTAPIAEELAYRGYLMRRIISRDFESVPFQAVRWPAIVVSALAFGLAQGALWLPGIAAGLAFGLVTVRRGRIGEAVAAHASANALIATAVLGWNQWQLW